MLRCRWAWLQRPVVSGCRFAIRALAVVVVSDVGRRVNGLLDFLAEPWRMLFRAIARPYVEAVRAEMYDLCVQRQREAWELGRQYGEAYGRLAGQRDLIAELESCVAERRDVLANDEDVAKVKKRLIH